MTISSSSLMPDQIIECISTGRDPTVQELFEVAERMWTDGAAGRSAFSWGRLSANSVDRLFSLRRALLALSGNSDLAYYGFPKEPTMAKDAEKETELRLPVRNADWSTDVTTQSGYAFHLRRASQDDEIALIEFSKQFDPDESQSQFLAGRKTVEVQQSHTVTQHKDLETETFLAIERDTDRIIATAMMSIDQDLHNARAAIVIRPDYESGGIRWRLLEHVAHFAASISVRAFEAIANCSDLESPALAGRLGWTAFPYQADPTLTVWRTSLDRALSDEMHLTVTGAG